MVISRERAWMCLLPVLVAVILIALPVAKPSLEARDGANTTEKKRPAAATARPLVWPLPPEQPRIRYVTTYRGINDFKTRKMPKWKTLLLGADDSDNRPSDVMVKPYGIAVSRLGRVYVADTAARRVFVFDPEAKTVSFVGERGPGKLTKPVGVAVDGDGKVFVADGSLNRVYGYDIKGQLSIAIGREGDLESPSGLAVDRTRNLLYVADAKKHHVLCYSTVSGSVVRTIGRRGGEPGEFNFPTNLFVNQSGRLYVTDTLNFRIQVFNPDGGFLGEFGTQGDTPGTLNRPKGVGVDSEGHVYVADSSFNNFQIFDAAGQLLLYVGSGGSEAGEFFLPAGLSIDDRDRIYVADQGNARVQVFEYLRPGSK
jgi:DNA-binding beta-propeller fold protein YncE